MKTLQVGSGSSNMSDGSNTEPLPGLESICEELLQEDGYGWFVARFHCSESFHGRFIYKETFITCR